MPNYRNTYGYKDLMRKYKLEDYGIWKILGEDPNCDFGGSHHNPYLGIVEGILDDVIKYAESLPNFWHWGAGGIIEKVDIKTVS